MLATGIVLFDVSVSPLEVIVTISTMFFGILCFTSMGFLISNFANNEGQINMISNLFFFPMIFGADTFYSLENAPIWVVKMGESFPLGYYVHGLRSSLGITTDGITGPILILIIYTVVLLTLSAITFKWETNSTIGLKKGKKRSNQVA